MLESKYMDKPMNTKSGRHNIPAICVANLREIKQSVTDEWQKIGKKTQKINF